MRRLVVAALVAALCTLLPAPTSGLAVAPGAQVASGAARPAGHDDHDGQGSAVRPVPGVVVRGFEAPRRDYGPGHRGVALAASPGEVVRAALPGTVAFSGDVARRGWVTVAHGGGLETTYGWLAEREVVRGRVVQAGEVLGRLDDGRPHLHWGARLHGTYLDPLLLLGRWKAYLVPVGASA